MSQALTYLSQVRPQAMGHYMAFLKDSGSRLDPKTRALISIITKVHAQTSRGFKHYLKLALAQGCQPGEVLDALLMAFPALGLTKIVWAVDIILTMDLPGFDPNALLGAIEQGGDWHDLLADDALDVGQTTVIAVSDRRVFVHRSECDYCVTDCRCPHEANAMQLGDLQGHTLTCRKHHRQFDIRNGECIAQGHAPLRRYQTRWVDSRLQAQW